MTASWRNYSTCAGCKTRFHQWEIESWRFPQCPQCGGVFFVADPSRLMRGAMAALLLVALSFFLSAPASAASCTWSYIFSGSGPFTASGAASNVTDACNVVMAAINPPSTYAVSSCTGSMASGSFYLADFESSVTFTSATPECAEEEEEEPEEESLPTLLVVIGAALMFAVGFGAGNRP